MQFRTPLFVFVCLLTGAWASTAQAQCSGSFSPTSVAVPASNVATFLVRVNTGCSWTATTTSDWISIANPGPFVGNASLVVTVANNSGASRRGTIQVGNQAFVVQQSGFTCAFLLTPETINVPSAGGTASVALETDPSCAWTYTVSGSWLSALPSTLSGPGTIALVAQPNTGPKSRTGKVTVGSRNATVLQAGIGISFSADSIQNASSLQSGPLSPGEIFVIYGNGLGAPKLQTLQTTGDGQALMTTLGNTRVLFDGILAPLIYASDTQVSAIVPYSVAGPLAHLTVEYMGVSSSPVTVPILPVNPGIFTISQTGSGQGAVRNEDFSINSPDNPATPGDTLVVYWTGGGVLSVSVADGRLVSTKPPYPLVTSPITATLGDSPARIIYAGAVPTLAPGILQANVVIPADAPAGDAVPLSMVVGGTPTQTGVTVAIR